MRCKVDIKEKIRFLNIFIGPLFSVIDRHEIGQIKTGLKKRRIVRPRVDSMRGSNEE